MSAAEVASISSEFDIFAHKPVQTSVLGTIETAYKHIAPVEQNDLEFLIPGDKDNYIRLDIQLYVWGKLVSSSGINVDVSDHTGVPILSSLTLLSVYGRSQWHHDHAIERALQLSLVSRDPPDLRH